MKVKISLGTLLLALLACSIPSAEAPAEQTPLQEALAEEIVGEEPTPAPPTATPEPTPEPFPGASNACSLAYYPVVEGAQWVYDAPDEPAAYVVTQSNVRADSFTILQEYEDSSFSVSFACSEEGLLQTEYVSDTTIEGDVTGMTFETIDPEGITFPRDPQPSDTWRSTYTWRIATTESENTIDSTVTIESTYAADEEITLNGETVTAARIEINRSTNVLGTELNETITQWYVDGIGLVRSEAPDEVGFRAFFELSENPFGGE